jgi:transposase InsO family protein
MKARARFVKPAWTLSVRKQCELLSVSRGQLYYTPKEERPENLQIMRIMNEHLLAHPTEGVRSMVHLLTDHHFQVNPKRIRRLFGLMGYRAIYARRNLSKLGLAHYIKPYLLRGIKITRPNQVWCTDITYIPSNFMEKQGIKISMDGKGRATDNAWIERFWRTIKKDHLYLNPAETSTELYQQVEYFVNYYNKRFHQGIKDKPNNLYTSNSLPLNKAS